MNQELFQLGNASQSPLKKYWSWNQFYKAHSETIYDWRVNKNPITRIFKQQIDYCIRHGKNLVLRIQGPQRSLKSLTAVTIGTWIEPGFRPKDRIFYNNVTLTCAVDLAERNTVLIKDEDPREYGIDSQASAMAVQNLEATMGQKGIFFIFVYVKEVGHMEHYTIDTFDERVIWEGDKKAKYSIVKVLIPSWYNKKNPLIGTMPVEIASQDVIQEYEEIKNNFLDGMSESGGAGLKRTLAKKYDYIWPELAIDEIWQGLDKDSKKVRYLSATYGMTKETAGLILDMRQIHDRK